LERKNSTKSPLRDGPGEGKSKRGRGTGKGGKRRTHTSDSLVVAWVDPLYEWKEKCNNKRTQRSGFKRLKTYLFDLEHPTGENKGVKAKNKLRVEKVQFPKTKATHLRARIRERWSLLDFELRE